MLEEWRIITEATNYEISNLGKVKNSITGQILKGRLCKNGYLQVSLKIIKTNKFTNRYIHRLVAQYWLGNPENKQEVNHKDGNKQNNIVSNLEWVTPSENQKHRHSIGITKTSNRRIAKINPITKEIIKEYNSIKEATKEEGILGENSISAVLCGINHTLYGYSWIYLD